MKWIIGLILLIFIIIFHELGHFIAAKICGVKVESFSVGFGPVLLHKKFHGTDYRLSLIPLGGYCGMKGEKDFQRALEEDLDYIPGEPDSLYGVHPLKRTLVAFLGPFFNFIFAILAYSVINLIGFSYYTSSNQILIPEPAENISSVARDAGLLSGDKIIFINDIEITCFEDISKEIMIRPDEDIVVIVDRNGETLTFNMHTDMNKDEGSGKIGISNDPSTYIIKETPKYNFFTAIGAGVKEAFDNLKLTFKSLGILFKGINIKNAVSGPLRVTDLLGSTVTESFAGSFKIGVINSLQLLAIISISLFIMNLLPIPVLDGGIILFAIIECITRKKIKPKIQYYIQFIGVAFIIVIFCVGLFGDISYLINK